MARGFTGENYIQYSGQILSAYPLTLAAWFNSTSATSNQTIIAAADSTSSVDTLRLMAGGSVASDILRYQINDGSALDVDTSTGYSTNTWHHAIGWSSSLTDHNVEIDAGGAGSSATSKSPTFANQDNMSIGRFQRSSPIQGFEGSLAEAAIWSAVLTAGERAALAAGYSPLFIRPQSLVAYWPLIRDEDQDRVGGFDMTPTGSPTIATHPPIIYPTTPHIWYAAAAVAGSGMLVHPGMDGGMYG